MKFRKLFKLPSPVDLGWSESNALGMEDFAQPGQKTWEDWARTVKKMHPVRYFLGETLPDFCLTTSRRYVTKHLSNGWYWFVSHVFPSRRYHMLDLRQLEGYRYGWQDVDEKMLFAWFNLLGEYLNEKPYDLTKDHSREEIEADPNMKHQQDSLDEARAIYHWWIVERQDSFKAQAEMEDLWWEAKKAKDHSKELYWTRLSEMKEQLETQTDEMLMRLIRIRRSLWT